jgi:hypothetical protein
LQQKRGNFSGKIVATESISDEVEEYSFLDAGAFRTYLGIRLAWLK